MTLLTVSLSAQIRLLGRQLSEDGKRKDTEVQAEGTGDPACERQKGIGAMTSALRLYDVHKVNKMLDREDLYNDFINIISSPYVSTLASLEYAQMYLLCDEKTFIHMMSNRSAALIVHLHSLGT